MKKTYLVPAVEIQNVAIENNILTVSVKIDGEYSGTGEDIDTKAEADWNIWSDDEE